MGQPVLPVPDVRQATGESCGAAALRAVLAYYGVRASELELMSRLTGPDGLAPHPGKVVAVARGYGLAAEAKEHLTVPDLAAFIR